MKIELAFLRKALPLSKVYLAGTDLYYSIDSTSLDSLTEYFDSSYCRVVFDSNAVKQGDSFVALKGAVHDGHDFIEDVINRGVRLLFSLR